MGVGAASRQLDHHIDCAAFAHPDGERREPREAVNDGVRLGEQHKLSDGLQNPRGECRAERRPSLQPGLSE